MPCDHRHLCGMVRGPMHAVRKMALLSIATSIATIVLKFSAWFITSSVSLWSDALESLVNLAAGLVALGAVTLAEQPADERHTYGHDKAEYFSSGVEGTLIVVAAVAIVWSAVHRLIEPQPLERLGPGLFVAFLAGAANFATARVMLRVARQHDSITIEADARHLMTDVWTSVGILSGLGVVMLVPQWAILDPLMAILVGVHIVVTGVGLLRRSADGLMDAALPPAEVRRAEALIRDELPACGELSRAAHAQGGCAALPRIPSARSRDDDRRSVARAVRPDRGDARGTPRARAHRDPRRAAGDADTARVSEQRPRPAWLSRSRSCA